MGFNSAFKGLRAAVIRPMFGQQRCLQCGSLTQGSTADLLRC